MTSQLRRLSFALVSTAALAGGALLTTGQYEFPNEHEWTPQAAADWDACRDHALPFFRPAAPDLCLWRLSVPQTAPVLELPYPQLVEWQGAQRWLWAPASAATAVRAAAAAVQGHATLFRAGADGAPGVRRFDTESPALQAITRRLGPPPRHGDDFGIEALGAAGARHEDVGV